ncbi:hypothetical protein SAMN04489806_1178 [Paramicrobacterium humi]|uniref:Uncharacterized protein n=1 Tax=Paramicrobacterium humi TaxID=640635 RepID=A0A1H4KIU4_9MICO|nr:hypothetical protein [Microbacterium humi]SEB58176.1 hypothetical protein SAMN04489806_1178 [Microbacterium humi]
MSVRDREQQARLIWGWALVGSAVACTGAVVAVAGAAVRYLSALAAGRVNDEPVEVDASAAENYTQVRISGVTRKMTLDSASPVPPENPHAPPGHA